MSWEVLTMRSAKSFCDPTIARSDLRHYWPLLFLYVGVWFLLLPMQVWISASRYNAYDLYDSMAPARSDALLRVCLNNYSVAIIMALLFGVAMVMAVFSYTMNTRSVGAMHALPIRRGSLFATHFLAGFGMLTAGNLLIALLTLLAALATGVPLHSALLSWLLMSTVLDLFFMALATLCAMLTGWLLAVPVLYAAANGGVIALVTLGRMLSALLVRGYCMGDSFPALVRWLTPLYQMFFGLCQTGSGWMYAKDNDEVPSGLAAEGWQTLLWYGVAALVLLALAVLLYQRRRSELSGDPVAFRWLRPVFRLGIGLSGGLGLGLMLYYIITLYSAKENVLPNLLVSMVLMGALSYFAAAMLVNKSLKVFRRGWRGAALTAALLVLLCVGLKLDLLGQSRLVPEQEDVLQVSAGLGVTGTDGYSADPEVINAALALHQGVLESGEPDGADYRNYFHVKYELRSGRVISRRYDFRTTDSAVQEPLQRFVSLPQVQKSFLMEDNGEGRLLSGYLYLYGEKYESEEGATTVELTAAQAEELYQALQRDIDAARVLTSVDSFRTLTLNIELYGEDRYCGIYQLTDTCTDTLAVLESILGYPVDDLTE